MCAYMNTNPLYYRIYTQKINFFIYHDFYLITEYLINICPTVLFVTLIIAMAILSLLLYRFCHFNPDKSARLRKRNKRSRHQQQQHVQQQQMGISCSGKSACRNVAV